MTDAEARDCCGCGICLHGRVDDVPCRKHAYLFGDAAGFLRGMRAALAEKPGEPAPGGPWRLRMLALLTAAEKEAAK